MSNKIVLCADSTCDLGDELKAKYGVQYFPFHVILDGKTYGDGVDLTPDQIYAVYREKRSCPRRRPSTPRNTWIFSNNSPIRAMR